MNKRKIKYLIYSTVVLALILLWFLNTKNVATDSRTDIPGQVVAPVSQEAADPKSKLPEETAKPELEAMATKTPTAKIVGYEGRKANGTATIITTTEGTFIRLEDDFTSSAAAPDNRVYLGNSGGRQVEIAKLKAPSGAQNFAVPANINVASYTHIWIHCKAFNATYGVGEIVR